MKRALIMSLLAVLTSLACAQDTRIGLPMFGSFDQTPYDTINRQNLNTHVTIPIANISGRGVPFQFSLFYDSINWSVSSAAWTPNVNSSGAATWGWGRSAITGGLTYKTQRYSCIYQGAHVSLPMLSAFVYTDATGTPHPFSVSLKVSCDDNQQFPSLKAYSTDGAGYLFTSNSATQTFTVTPPSGVITSATQIGDTNGNYVSVSTKNSVATWTDTRSNNVAIIDDSVSGVSKFEIIDQSGGNSTVYTLNYTSYNIKTAFGCSGVTEYSASSVWLPTSLTLPTGQTYTFAYESTGTGYTSGRMTQMTTPTGAVYNYSYGGINCTDGTYTALTRSIVANGATNTWSFSRSGVNTTITYPQMPYDSAANNDIYAFSGAHETARLNYQGSTLLQKVTTTWDSTGNYPAQITTTLPGAAQHKDQKLTWSSYGQLLGLTEYDWTTSSGTGTALRTTTLTYESSLKPSYVTANLLNRIASVQVFDGDGSSSSALRSSSIYSYDDPNGVAQNTCPSGTLYHHDNTDYSCSNGGSAGGSSTYPRGLLTTVTQYTGIVSNAGTNPITTKYTYDVFGNRLTSSTNNSALTSQVQQVSAVYSSTTQYSAPDSITVGSGTGSLTTNYVYYLFTGLVMQVTDPNGGGIKQQTYDYMLRPWVTTRPDGTTITNTYDDSRLTVSTTTPFSSPSSPSPSAPASLTSESWADQLGRVYRTQSPTGTVDTLFDPLSRPYQVSVPYTGAPSAWSTIKYDALGRTLSVTSPDNIASTFSYNTSSSPAYYVISTDGAGKQRKAVYDGLGQLTTLYEPDVNNGNSLTVSTSYIYFPSLNTLASVSQGAQSRSFAYDGLGRLMQATTPEAGSVQYTYDTCSLLAPNVCTRTDKRGVVTSYAYDSLNRLSQVSYNVGSSGVPATPTVTYTYGTTAPNIGRLVQIADNASSPHVDTYTYDVMGNVLSQSQSVDNVIYTTKYTPNWAGLPAQLTYPSGDYLTYGYTSSGLLNSINGSDGKVYVSNFSYTPSAQISKYTLGWAQGPVTVSYGYTPGGLLQTLGYSVTAGTLFNLSYGYAQNSAAYGNGQITSIVDNMQGGRTASYGYDALNRITSYSTSGSTAYSAQAMSWTYDRYGNRLTQTQNGSVQTLSPSSSTNQLTGYSYDANGNLTKDVLGNSLAWDAANRLVSYGAGGVVHEYDGNGLRVRRTASGNDLAYVFSGTLPLAEYAAGAAAGSYSTEYVYLGSQLIAKKTSSSYTFLVRDHHSVRQLLVDAAGTPTEEGHLPFGETWYGSTNDNKWQFTSYERDTTSGDDYAQARRYQYVWGRFDSPDPIGGSLANPQSLNRYVYTQSDPVNWYDPSGMQTAGPGNPCVGDTAGIVCGGEGSGEYTVDGLQSSKSTVAFLLSLGWAAPCNFAQCYFDDESGVYTTVPAAKGELVLDCTGPYANPNCQQRSYHIYYQSNTTYWGSSSGGTGSTLPSGPGDANNTISSVPKPSDPILMYATCSSAVTEQAEQNYELLEMMSATTMGNAAGACGFTGEGILLCDGVLLGLEVTFTGVNYGAKQYSIYQGQTACMQNP